MARKIINGFLNDEYSKQYEFIRDEYDEFLTLANDLNRFCHEILNDLKPKSDNIQQILSTILFIRILEIYQSIIILIKKGLTAPCKMLARCMLDPMSIIVAIKNDKDFVNIVIKSYEFDKLNMIKKAKELDIKQFYENDPEFSFDEEIENIESKIKSEGISEIKSIGLLRQINLFKTYGGAFVMLSESVHSNIGDIDRNYLYAEENITIKYGPNNNDFNRILITSFAIVLEALDSINSIFDLNKNESIEKFDSKLKDIS